MLSYHYLLFLCLIIAYGAIDALAPPPPFQDECVSGKYPPKPSKVPEYVINLDAPPSTTWNQQRKVPEYVINLDAPPMTRWSQLARDKGQEIKGLISTFKSLISSLGKGYEILLYLIDHDLGWVADTLPPPYGDEIKGIANVTGIPLGEVVLYNIFYEIFTVCTSIVAEDKSGKLYHARNLDFGLFMGWNTSDDSWEITTKLRPMIVNVDFQKGGKTVFKSVNFAGYVGVITGMKQNKFTLSMNERFNSKGGYIGLFEWLVLGDRSSNWVGFLGRDALEKDESFTAAKNRLIKSPLMAPAYFILGGNSSNEGLVITRSRQKAVDVWGLNTKNNTWYLLETNYDHWQPPPFYDDRRTPGNNCMHNKTQSNMGFEAIFNVLSSKPVLNKLTTYTALMQVNEGRLETYLQYCPDPCWPW